MTEQRMADRIADVVSDVQTYLTPRKSMLFMGSFCANNDPRVNYVDEWRLVSGQTWQWEKIADGYCNPDHYQSMSPYPDSDFVQPFTTLRPTPLTVVPVSVQSDTYCDATLFGDAYLDYIDSGHAIPGH